VRYKIRVYAEGSILSDGEVDDCRKTIIDNGSKRITVAATAWQEDDFHDGLVKDLCSVFKKYKLLEGDRSK